MAAGKQEPDQAGANDADDQDSQVLPEEITRGPHGLRTYSDWRDGTKAGRPISGDRPLDPALTADVSLAEIHAETLPCAMSGASQSGCRRPPPAQADAGSAPAPPVNGSTRGS